MPRFASAASAACKLDALFAYVASPYDHPFVSSDSLHSIITPLAESINEAEHRYYVSVI